jgi:hypothetical protein
MKSDMTSHDEKLLQKSKVTVRILLLIGFLINLKLVTIIYDLIDCRP